MKKPFVSALIVCRNEEKYIEISLQSLLGQNYPDDCYEIIIIDGDSDDNTLKSARMVISEYREKNDSCPNVSFYFNEKKILAAGWNIGIMKAKGEYVFRIDAHSKIEPNYIDKCIETITVHDAVCVGGRIESKSLSGEDDIVTKILSSPFGVGNSSFRVSNTEEYADTAVYGLYRKQIFEEVGYFDESLIRNQDIELHARIRKAGEQIYFNPEIKSIYFTRNTIKKMLKQAFQNGKWNPIVLKKTKGALSVRHMIPFAFVLFIVASTILGFFVKMIWYLEIIVLGIHLSMGFYFAKEKSNDPKELAQMPFLFMALHLSYGVGFLTGLFHKSDKGEKQ